MAISILRTFIPGDSKRAYKMLLLLGLSPDDVLHVCLEGHMRINVLPKDINDSAGL